MQKRTLYDRVTEYALILIFLFALTTPLVLWISQHDTTYSKTEKRYLYPLSDVLKQGAVTNITHGFDQYFQDHFGLRDWMIHRYQREMTKRFGTTGTASVLEGQDNWLFFALDGLPDDFKGQARFTPAEQRHFWTELQRRKQWYQSHNAKYMLLVAPNKQSIYPEFLPHPLQDNAAPTRLDTLLKTQPQWSEDTILDVRPQLLAAKKHYRLYDITDTHWNYRGAYIAYQGITALSQNFFSWYTHSPTFQFAGGWDFLPGGDLALMSGRTATTTEARPILVKDHFTSQKRPLARSIKELLTLPELQPEYYHNPNGRLRVLILHDSFFNPLKPFVSEKYGDTLFIWTHYNDATLYYFTASTMARLLEIYKPDIIIEEIVERHLEQFLYPFLIE